MIFSLRSKLLFCCGILVFLTCGLSFYAIYAVENTSAILYRVYDEALISISSARAAAGKLITARDLMDRAANSPTGATVDQIAALKQSAADIGDDLSVVRERVFNHGVRQALSNADKARDNWLQSALMILDPPKGGASAIAFPGALVRMGSAASSAHDDVVDQIAAYGFTMRAAATAEMHTYHANLLLATLGIATTGLLLALGFAHLLTRPIQVAIRVAENVAGGNYTDQIQTRGRDEFGRLLLSLARMQENLIGRATKDRDVMQRLRELWDSTFEGILIHCDGVVLDANAAFCLLVGQPVEQVKGHLLDVFSIDLDRVSHGSNPNSMAVTREIVIRRRDGTLAPVEVQSRNIEYGDRIAKVTALRDLRERRATEARTHFLAHHDLLTGLPNRRLLQAELSNLTQTPEDPAALLFLDLDRFKAVNDTMGHAAGDALLVEVARRLQAVSGPENMVARLGGDEFVVLCKHHGREAIAALGEEIRKVIERPFELSGRLFHISASVGMAFAKEAGNIDLIQAADMAMYAAKREGGNRGLVFETALFDQAAKEVELEHDLRQALANGKELVLLYQPIFSLRGAERAGLVGFEALVRWRHPRNGWMSPNLFVPLAEKSGLILPLGDWVLTAALRQGRALHALRQGVVSVNVNVSPSQITKAGFADAVSEMLLAEGFPPSSLCLEVTESVLSTTGAAAVLADIRKLGVRVAIDDFGVGYSSLSYLRRLPVDVVKLDRSFLEDVAGSDNGNAFIEAVVALAHSVDKTVVLEGIETQAQFDLATAARADMVQGFLFAPPLSESATKDLVVQHQRLDAQWVARSTREPDYREPGRP